MLRKSLTARHWPVWIRVAITGATLATAYFFQLPIERVVPGEPFLLFLLVVIGATIVFGQRVGFFAVGLSTFLSIPFFEPFGTLGLTNAYDLFKVEVYAVVAAGCVAIFSSFSNTLIDALKDVEHSNVSKSLLLRELAHGVANNFTTVAALISTKSTALGDTKAKLVLDEAVDQVLVMARVHRRLRAGTEDVSLDSRIFIEELCDDLKVVARGRPLPIQCQADSCPLRMDQAVLIGLILNELATNAIKHAFPGDRSGCIDVRFEALADRLGLRVRDDGIGPPPTSSGHRSGQGKELLKGLCQELQGTMEVEPTTGGSSFHLSFPYVRPQVAKDRVSAVMPPQTPT
jgi:two-component system, sensor histidine kinase PdtaS